MKKKKIIISLISLLILISLGLIIYFWLRRSDRSSIEVDKDLAHINLDKVDKLMFVAHPDDDSIWGGAHLIEDGNKYLVVCITCGVRKDRALEFEEAMGKTGSEYLMLGYPDKTNGEKDNWDTSRDGIRKDVQEIIDAKDWNLIVTHNPDGEYGHIHHKMTSSIVSDIADHNKLMYFGKYYKKSIIDDYKDQMVELKEDIYNKKIDLIKVYKTQDFVFDMFGQMFGYESWLSYEEWYSES